MRKRVKQEPIHPRPHEIKEIVKIVIYLVTYLITFFLAFGVFTGPNLRYDVAVRLSLSFIIFGFGYYATFRHQDCWEMVHHKYNAWARRPMRYFDCVTPKMKREDKINGMILMILFGIGAVYSIIRLIFFCR